jgi:hypothetical protein
VLVSTFLSSHAQHQWKELVDFHEVMGGTYHPAEEGKLLPTRNRSQEMLDKAIAWKNSTAPEGFDKKAIKKDLKELVREASSLNKLVKVNATDAKLKDQLAYMHDLFHTIEAKCEKKTHQ